MRSTRRLSLRRRSALLMGAASLAAPALLTVQAGEAQAFGTINSLGQRAEHERITRAALACAAGTASDGSCFEARSIDQVAGHTGTFGAVGSPDSDEIFTPEAHCDDADYLTASGYPRTRQQASDQLIACISKLQGRFSQGVAAGSGTLNGDGTVSPGNSDLSTDCTFTGGVPGRGKCNAIEGFGRALHGVQDFYSHSNWADKADPNQAVGVNNPPGLNMSGPAPLLSLKSGRPPAASSVPAQLSTGCFSLNPWGCSGRVTHTTLNKDTGLIDPATGATSDPTTNRGRIPGNFDRAVKGAIADTRRQWADFRSALNERYGAERGQRIACVLTHDNPVRDCR
ncbi:CinY protein [Streptomyces sp. SCA3-4]|uniref:CinY protein n=1 Tax=Streptomyces sichuanensis TaxID=2871810 RepID=UPI001CE2B8E2|nr:CinY protein [Streptomyces sichuanensis]MCA6092854.1 CinY protein [Streptomyces sichuanensis]